jgi:hypothetical protein
MAGCAIGLCTFQGVQSIGDFRPLSVESGQPISEDLNSPIDVVSITRLITLLQRTLSRRVGSACRRKQSSNFAGSRTMETSSLP